MTPLTLTDCEALDRSDALRHLRDEFILAPGRIYLDGNSLGLLTRAARARVRATVDEEWGGEAIQGWRTRDWITLPERLGGRIARLIGADADEVTVADSTSINLFKLAACCRPVGGRRNIVTELGNFSTDLYVLQGLGQLVGPAISVRAVPREDIASAIDQDTLLVVLTHVHYKTAELFDLAALTRRAHDSGAAILWDLSHSVGALPVDLGGAGADFAVGCTYKYLNGGPGAPAFLYVRRDLQAAVQPALSGWLGHAEPFGFSDHYEPAAGVRRHLCGTPGILGLAALDGGLTLFDEIDMQAVRRKSNQLTDLFIELIERECADRGLTLATPRANAQRGSHVSLRHEHGYEIMQALIARGVIGDFRAPDVMRFGFTPLYTSFTDCWRAVALLREILDSEVWREAQYRIRSSVT